MVICIPRENLLSRTQRLTYWSRLRGPGRFNVQYSALGSPILIGRPKFKTEPETNAQILSARVT